MDKKEKPNYMLSIPICLYLNYMFKYKDKDKLKIKKNFKNITNINKKESWTGYIDIGKNKFQNKVLNY